MRQATSIRHRFGSSFECCPANRQPAPPSRGGGGAGRAAANLPRVSASELERAVTAVVRDCLGVREGEEVLVVANPGTIGLGERMRAEAGRLGADGVVPLIADRATHGTEHSGPGAAAM